MKKLKFVFIATILLLLVCGTGAFFLIKEREENLNKEWKLFSATQIDEGIEIKITGENLMRKKGVVVTADSEENETQTVSMIYDGVYDNMDLRWSSDNDWEDTEHWVQVKFPEAVEVGSVRLYWERLNALQYALEISEDGTEWETVFSADESPEGHCQDIILTENRETQYLRLHVMDVNKLEEDASLYYQNVSLLEMEVYGAFEDEFVLQASTVEQGKDRTLKLPEVPWKYELEFLGADYENLIDQEGNIADTLSVTEVEIGYALHRGEKSVELPAVPITILGSEDAVCQASFPEGYEPMEYLLIEGKYTVEEQVRILIEEAQLEETAGLFAEELAEQAGINAEVVLLEEGTMEANAKAGDFCLGLLEEVAKGLGEEGYQLTLGTEQRDVSIIEANTITGIRWGCVALLELVREKDKILPRGTVRDYPAYEVRGFGIDVGRKAIPLDMLYRIVEAMSEEKMNTLLVHLNDNQIIAQSEYDGTLEGARNLYGGFRLESDIRNEAGTGITSTDLFYTKEEFSQFIHAASVYGVQVVPEIDTPAHSLALTKVFPELGRSDDANAADQLDLSKQEARELAKQIWKEYLVSTDGEDAVFEECKAVHIGMDEYFGTGEEFASYMTEMESYLTELAPGKEIRMWGSLTRMGADYSGLSQDVQLYLWSTEWADPGEMYEAGFGIINTLSKYLYIVPGSGYDRLDVAYLQEEWQPNVFESSDKTWVIPSYSDQMLGACYMVWNDMVFYEEIEISDEYIYERFEEPLPVIADKLWR